MTDNQSIWTKDGDFYTSKSNSLLAIVEHHGHFFRAQVMYKGVTVDLAEWDGLDPALTNTERSMQRACWLRRFEPNPPVMPDGWKAPEDEPWG